MTRLHPTIQDHLREYPKARPSTLAYISKRDEMTKRLRNETRLNREPRRNVLQVIKRLVGWA